MNAVEWAKFTALVVGSVAIANVVFGALLASRYGRWTLRGLLPSALFLFLFSCPIWFIVSVFLAEADVGNDIAVRVAEIEKAGAVAVITRDRNLLVTTRVVFDAETPDGRPASVSGTSSIQSEPPIVGPTVGMAGIWTAVALPIGWVVHRRQLRRDGVEAGVRRA